jgi:transposase
MLYIGIDVASQKHDLCIIDSDGAVLLSNLTFANSREGFEILYNTILKYSPDGNISNTKIGLESTGHYSINLVSFLREKQLNITIFNPLHVNLYRKAQSLRKTKTDKTDARFLAVMLFSDDSKSYSQPSYQIVELKSLVRHRFRLIEHRSRLKLSVSRLSTILFPELKSAVWSIHQNSAYELMLALPTAKDIADCHLTKLTNLLTKASKGKYTKEKAAEIKILAGSSIGLNSISMGFELQQTIRIINNLQTEIEILDAKIKSIMLEIDSPILSIPGVSYVLGSIIIAEIGDIHNFSSSAKLLAFAGLEPSTYQSGNYTAGNTPMVKHGSAYLRWAFLNAARLVAMRDDTFKAYLNKKKAEGKHHFVVLSHVGKKLVRVVFQLLKTNSEFIPQS